jgi:hypothetical protein
MMAVAAGIYILFYIDRKLMGGPRLRQITADDPN